MQVAEQAKKRSTYLKRELILDDPKGVFVCERVRACVYHSDPGTHARAATAISSTRTYCVRVWGIADLECESRVWGGYD